VSTVKIIEAELRYDLLEEVAVAVNCRRHSELFDRIKRTPEIEYHGDATQDSAEMNRISTVALESSLQPADAQNNRESMSSTDPRCCKTRWTEIF